MATLTTANSVFALAIAGLYPVAQILQGYSTDDAFAAADIAPAEVVMGVDGKLSGGFVPVPRVIDIMLQADSASNQIFDDWNAAQESARELYIASAIISLQGTSQKYSLTRGIMTSYSPMPTAKKILQPRKFVITFESCTPSPI
jgi:hypothetical protein